MAEFKDKSVLAHLIKCLDARYLNLEETMSNDVIDGILNGTVKERDLAGGVDSSASPVSSNSGDDNSTGPKYKRVLNYPGLMHLIPRLDKRYYSSDWAKEDFATEDDIAQILSS